MSGTKKGGGQMLRKIVLLIVIGVLSGVSAEAMAQSCSPYSDFLAMNLTDLSTLQVKLTYVGIQDKGIPSVGFSSQVFDPTLFIPFRNPTVDYSNDNAKINTFLASAQELQAVISNVGTLPNVTAGGVATAQFLSFAMVNPVLGNKCFEAVLNDVDTAALFAQLRLAFSNNPTALRRLNDLGCPLTVLDPLRPSDVTAQITTSLSGFRINRATGHFVGVATLTNKSTSPIGGPISLVINLTGNVRLFNVTGTTCGVLPAGLSFIDVPLVGNSLPAGGSAQVTLEILNPDAQVITPTTKVLAGPGAR
jgi:hypothetical protein